MMLFRPEEAHIRVTSGRLSNGTNGQAIKVGIGPAQSFGVSAPTPAEPEAGQAFNVTLTALDAGGDVATSYGGAAGQSKTIEYSGPEASPSGRAPEYPGSATTVNFREGVGTATGIKLYRAAETTLSASEGGITGSAGFNVKTGAFKDFGVTPAPRRTAGGPGIQRHHHRVGSIREPDHQLHAHAPPALRRRRKLRERQGAGILHEHPADLRRRPGDAHRLPLLQVRPHHARSERRNHRARRLRELQRRRRRLPTLQRHPGRRAKLAAGHRVRRPRVQRPGASAARRDALPADRRQGLRSPDRGVGRMGQPGHSRTRARAPSATRAPKARPAASLPNTPPPPNRRSAPAKRRSQGSASTRPPPPRFS